MPKSFFPSEHSPTTTVERILHCLRTTTHNGFPVVCKEGRLQGIILRAQLRQILKRQLFYDASELQESSSPKVNNGEAEQVNPMVISGTTSDAADADALEDPEEGRSRTDSIDEAMQAPLDAREEERDIVDDKLLSHPKFTQEIGEGSVHQKMAHLERFMNQGPHVVQTVCPVSRAYHLFITIGLRHLPVLDAEGKVVGILTRKDMLSLNAYEPTRAEFEAE